VPGNFLWESITSRFYRPKSWFCRVASGAGDCPALHFQVLELFFQAGVVSRAGATQLGARVLPLGVSFLTFEFIRYATDRCKSKTEAGSLGEYLAFVLILPAMVAGPIKRYQEFLPWLRSEPSPWPNDWHRGVTRILAGLAKKFAIADAFRLTRTT
jgi:alginate O-acetyltransferase complex protein AlgI